MGFRPVLDCKGLRILGASSWVNAGGGQVRLEAVRKVAKLGG